MAISRGGGVCAQVRLRLEQEAIITREAFKALSADALKQTQPEFLRLANEAFPDPLRAVVAAVERFARRQRIGGTREESREKERPNIMKTPRNKGK